ncbi:MAG: hypothetical protein ACREQT_17725 [Candidatus Binataceae bacterium]
MAALYGPLGAADLFGTVKVDLRTLVGGLLAGIGGARLLTQQANQLYNEATKKQGEESLENLLKAATGRAQP